MMSKSNGAVYTSKIIRAGALLPDTKALLAHWDERGSVQDNLERLNRENVFGKGSRARVSEILREFRQRYLHDVTVTRSLVSLLRGEIASEALDRVLYFYAAQSDRLLHDVVTDLLSVRHDVGLQAVYTTDIEIWIRQQIADGKTDGQWSASTVTRSAQGVLSALRDFGVLQGAVKKTIAPVYLPVEAFAYIAFVLHQNQPSGERLLADPDWRLFFLSRQAVERFFLEAHQHQLLEYHAAGSVIRISFPTESLEDYAHALTQRTN